MPQNRRLARWAGMLLVPLVMACNGATPPATPAPGATPQDTAVAAAPTFASEGTASPTPGVPFTMPAPQPAISVGGARFTVEVAATAQERSQGLSGRTRLDPGTGLLFVFDQPGIHQFWMYDMRFPLDFVWISAGCVVADLTPGVPPPLPGQSTADLPRYRPAQPVRYVLELNAGEIAAAGVRIGDAVSFQNMPAVTNGC